MPGDPVLNVCDKDVAAAGPYRGGRRLTLTYPTINRARQVLWAVTGAEKVQMLDRLLYCGADMLRWSMAANSTAKRPGVLKDLQGWARVLSCCGVLEYDVKDDLGVRAMQHFVGQSANLRAHGVRAGDQRQFRHLPRRVYAERRGFVLGEA